MSEKRKTKREEKYTQRFQYDLPGRRRNSSKMRKMPMQMRKKGMRQRTQGVQSGNWAEASQATEDSAGHD